MNYKDIAKEISLLGESLELGGTISSKDCPKCNGGLSNDKSFTVTRLEQGLIYNCFRASCECSGFVPSKKLMIKLDPKERSKAFVARYYNKPTFGLSKDQKQFFIDTFYLTDTEVTANRLRYCPSMLSYVFTLFDEVGYVIGKQDRSYSDRKPKAINYWEKDRPNMHFPWTFGPDESGPIVLVEDIISSTKVCRHNRSVALLGTSVGEREIQLLMNLTDTIIFALDADATDKALKLKKKYQSCFKKCEVQILTKDPKDMTDGELKEAFDREY